MTSNCFDHKKANMLVLSNRPVLLRPSRMIYWSNVILLTLIDNIEYHPLTPPPPPTLPPPPKKILLLTEFTHRKKSKSWTELPYQSKSPKEGRLDRAKSPKLISFIFVWVACSGHHLHLLLFCRKFCFGYMHIRSRASLFTLKVGVK